MNVVSYSIFTNHPVYGHRPLYWECIPAVVRGHHHIFPGWEMRVHHDSAMGLECGRMARAYADAGLIKLVYVEENTSTCRSMLWRMLPCWCSKVHYTICRDIDSLPSARDRVVVEGFIRSGKVIHGITDNVAHDGLMGGMVGFSPDFKRVYRKSWSEFIAKGINLEKPSGGPDQNLINNELREFDQITLWHKLQGKPIDAAVPHDIPPALVKPIADLVPFLGAPGFDIAKAIEAFDTYGKQEVTARIKKAEQLAQLA